MMALFMILIIVLLALIRFSLAIIIRLSGYLSDAVLVSFCLLVLDFLFMPGLLSDTFILSPVQDGNYAYGLPLIIFALLVVLGGIIYLAFYRKVATYDRWLYAIRILMITMLPLIAAAGTINYLFNVNGLIGQHDINELLTMVAVGLPFVMFFSWVFASLAYIIGIRFSFMEPTDNTSPETFLFPPRMYQILFKRKADFNHAHDGHARPRKKTSFRRRKLRSSWTNQK